MVYRSGKLDTKWQQATVRRTSFTILVLMVLFYLFIIELSSTEGLKGFNIHTDIPLILLLAATYWGCNKYIGKRIQANIQLYDNSFYTLTESGVLCENDKNSYFFTWDEITWVRHSGCNIVLQLAHGNTITLILKDEPATRRKDALLYIQSHAGKTNDTQLIPPPLDMQQEVGLPYSARPQQLRETADSAALIKTAGFRRLQRYGLPIFWIAGLILGAFRGNYVIMGIALVFLLSNLYKQWRPGGSKKRVSRFRPYTLHTDGKRVLIKQTKCWILIKQAQAKACYKTPNNLLIDFGNNQYLGVNPDCELPPSLQVPEKPVPTKTPLAVLVLLLIAAPGAAFYAFTFNNLWHMHCVLNGKDTYKQHAYALTELDEYEHRWVRRLYIHRFEKDFNPLLKTHCQFCPVLIRIYWVDDRKVYTDYYFDSHSEIQLRKHYDEADDIFAQEITDIEYE